MVLPEAVKELLQVPAATADRVLGQTSVSYHVVPERLDQVHRGVMLGLDRA